MGAVCTTSSKPPLVETRPNPHNASAAPPINTCDVVPNLLSDRPSEPIPDLRAELIAACMSTSAWDSEGAGPEQVPSGIPLDEAPPRAVSDLRDLISTVSLVLAEIKANAAAAIEQAAAMRDAALTSCDRDAASVSASYDALVTDILHAEASKTAALEAELVAADALLERTENEIHEIVDLARSASDDAIISLQPGLSARLAEFVAVLRASPRGAQEDPTLDIVGAAPGESPYGDAFGCLRTSCITVAELSVLPPRTSECSQAAGHQSSSF